MSGQTVGVVGLGQMGAPIAGHLVDAGFDVVCHDIVAERRAVAEAAGAQACESARAVAERADVVITSLPSAAALRAALADDEGLLAAGERLVIVETSTLDLDTKQEARVLAEEAGAVLLDCPLSGTSAQAQEKDLVVFASGDEDAARACAPVFEAFGRVHHYLGAFGAGSMMKYLANHLVAVHNAAAAEAFVLGMKAGLDPQVIYDVLRDSAGSSRMFQVRGPMMVRGDYSGAGISGHLFRKDLGIIGGVARSLDCPVPLFSATSELYAAVAAHGLGELDAGAVCAVLERLAGLPERTAGG